MRLDILDMSKMKSLIKRQNMMNFVNGYDFVHGPIMVKCNEEDLGYIEDFVVEGNKVLAEILMFEDLGSDRVLRSEFEEDGTLVCLRTSDMGY